MKKLLLSLSFLTFATPTTGSLCNKIINKNITTLNSNKINSNVNQIIHYTDGGYDWHYKIYLNHSKINNWNEMRLNSWRTTFKTKVGYDLSQFKNNKVISIIEGLRIANNLYDIWIKDKIIIYDYGKGIIIQMNYSRYELLNVIVEKQQ